MLSSFNWVARGEGISLLILLFIAMPLKYIWDDPSWVRMVGMIHGVLFVAYVAWAIWVYLELKWSLKTLALVIIASIIPFGTFYVEKRYLS
jgi:integral membrane protein